MGGQFGKFAEIYPAKLSFFKAVELNVLLWVLKSHFFYKPFLSFWELEYFYFVKLSDCIDLLADKG